MSFFRCARPAQRWLADYGTVNGQRLPLRQMAQEIAEREGERWGPIWLSAQCHDNWEVDVGTLTVFTATETHGDWACNKTTQVMKNLLEKEHGAYIPWFRR